ncbi:MAG: hypothetical protein N2322_06095 [Terrimicrobiaceae bacterium]|nr:hypothetical protein [Terrimicrobiaceae bacterium]
MVQATARLRLTAEDVEFILRALARGEAEREALLRLLADEESRDEVLDLDELAAAVLDSPERLSISPSLLFYVLCRKVLKNSGVSSREASDYIASVLEAFTRAGRVREVEGGSEYFCDMVMALARAGGRQAFRLSSHLGDCAMFQCGLFAENLEKRRRRGAPGLAYFEELGGAGYRAAAGHPEARRLGLDGLYAELAGGFREIRLALNDLARRLLHFEAPPPLLAEI